MDKHSEIESVAIVGTQVDILLDVKSNNSQPLYELRPHLSYVKFLTFDLL